MIVAINKIDVPGANPMKVKQDLLQHGVVLEEFGGTVLSSEVSAKKGTNIDALLDQILLQAEILDLKANPNRAATGAVIEAQLDPGKGAIATILVNNGTLRVSDDFIYYVSTTGVTGTRNELDPSLLTRLDEIRVRVTKPLAVGFGISQHAHFELLNGRCDAIVVGSAIVRAVADGEPSGAAERAAAVVRNVLGSR